MHIDWSQVPEEQLGPKIIRRYVSRDGVTVARFTLKQGLVVPLHHHVNSQLSYALSGTMLFRVEGREVTVRAGECILLPPNAPHEVEFLEDCEVLDVFVPERADWAGGGDHYLRSR